MRIVFAGGGTGGHLYPAIALADALAGRERILFVGARDRLEARIVPRAGYELETIAARPLLRRNPLSALPAIGANVAGFVQAMRAIRRFSPDAVVATGGYVCFPVVAAARVLRTLNLARARLALLETNAFPGLTSRMLSPMVDEVWGAFPQAGAPFGSKYRITGVPVRASLLQLPDRTAAAGRFGLDPAARTLLVLGGSQGARTINLAIAALVMRGALPSGWQILHVSGERDYETIRAREQPGLADRRIVLVPYLDDMRDAYAMADLAVARAGASTLGELAALGIPSILVPYPFAAEQHQLHNARAFESAGAAIVIDDRDFNADALLHALEEIGRPERLAACANAARSLAAGDAVATIVARIETLVSRSEARA